MKVYLNIVFAGFEDSKNNIELNPVIKNDFYLTFSADTSIESVKRIIKAMFKNIEAEVMFSDGHVDDIYYKRILNIYLVDKDTKEPFVNFQFIEGVDFKDNKSKRYDIGEIEKLFQENLDIYIDHIVINTNEKIYLID